MSIVKKKREDLEREKCLRQLEMCMAYSLEQYSRHHISNAEALQTKKGKELLKTIRNAVTPCIVSDTFWEPLYALGKGKYRLSFKTRDGSLWQMLLLYTDCNCSKAVTFLKAKRVPNLEERLGSKRFGIDG